MCKYSYCDFLLVFTASVPLIKTWTKASETKKIYMTGKVTCTIYRLNKYMVLKIHKVFHSLSNN